MKKILFVDDEQYVLDGLGRLLREYRNEWGLKFALNGKEALDILSNELIDIVISDVRMPEMTGLDLLEKLQADDKTRDIPVVILTGDHERTLKRQALDLGAMDLLNKPINKEDLVARIRNVLKLKEYRDIIIRKNKMLEQQLVISQKMELVGVMAAGAVHDLSNLISIIVGYSSLVIEESTLDKEDASTLARIKKAGEKASDVVNQILKFSRLDEGLASIDIGDSITEILSIMRVTVPKSVKIQWSQPRDNFKLRINSVKFQQVLMNLCVNSVQAIGKNDGKLNVTLLKDGDHWMRLDVEDSGPGMDEETLGKIFHPLFTTKGPGKGTGLGLFVVKHIVDEYHGRIEVESKVGRGTCFRIYFPFSG